MKVWGRKCQIIYGTCSDLSASLSGISVSHRILAQCWAPEKLVSPIKCRCQVVSDCVRLCGIHGMVSTEQKMRYDEI